MRSGYQHIELFKESQPKSAYVIPMGKFLFTHAPCGLAQVPAYVQRLVNGKFTGLDFAFGYLDDILVFSSDIKTHLKHLEIFCEMSREADLKLEESW